MKNVLLLLTIPLALALPSNESVRADSQPPAAIASRPPVLQAPPPGNFIVPPPVSQAPLPGVQTPRVADQVLWPDDQMPMSGLQAPPPGDQTPPAGNHIGLPSSPTPLPSSPTPLNKTPVTSVPSPATISPDTSVTDMPDGLDLNALAPATPVPLMGTIVQDVAFKVDKQEVLKKPFVGLKLHVHNGSNSPIVFDGDRARFKAGNRVVEAISDAKLEAAVAPGFGVGKHQGRKFIANVATVSFASMVGDETIERGPVLARFGSDEKRREANASRFGLRVLWPGDDTDGTVYFPSHNELGGGEVELPVVTFPDKEIRGYLSATH